MRSYWSAAVVERVTALLNAGEDPGSIKIQISEPLAKEQLTLMAARAMSEMPRSLVVGCWASCGAQLGATQTGLYDAWIHEYQSAAKARKATLFPNSVETSIGLTAPLASPEDPTATGLDDNDEDPAVDLGALQYFQTTDTTQDQYTFDDDFDEIDDVVEDILPTNIGINAPFQRDGKGKGRATDDTTPEVVAETEAEREERYEQEDLAIRKESLAFEERRLEKERETQRRLRNGHEGGSGRSPP